MKNIANAKTKYFENKEHYLAFRQAWKDYHKDGHHKTEEGRLGCTHYLIHALLRERDIDKIFSPITEHKLGGGHPYRAFYAAKRTLRWFHLTPDKERGAWLLKPFGDTITNEMLSELGADFDDMQME